MGSSLRAPSVEKRRGPGTSAIALVALVVMLVTPLALLFVPSRAHAQPGGSVAQPKDDPNPPPPPPPPTTITAPVLKKHEGAQYPEQAIRDKVRDPVEIVLVLELDATGAVRGVTVENPQGHGFDEAATAAAKKLEFDPAKRNGQPISAKIRHKYAFAPPPSRLVGKVTKQSADTPIAGAPVTVTGANGEKRETTADEKGAWKIDGVPAGKYTITVAAGGYTQQAYEETVDPGEEVTIDVHLAREGGTLPPPPPPPGDDLEEITVRGVRPPREVTKRTLDQREMSRIPGTNGDALRAVQNLPGIARPPGLVGLLIVRGAGPQETGTFVDGTYVPIIYHFGGLSSVIPTEMLERIDFYPGNFSSYFGRFTAGIVDVGVKDPKLRKDPTSKQKAAQYGIRGLVQGDLIDARTVVQGPLGSTGWNFALAGRRSYVDVWLKPALEQAGAGVTTAPVYYDYQAILQRQFGKNQNLRLFFFGSDDRLEILVRQVNGSNPGIGGNVTFGTAFWRLQARYVAKLSDDGDELRVVGAVGKDAVDFDVGDIYFKVDSYPISNRIELSNKLANGVRNNVGTDVLLQPYVVDVRAPPPPRPGEPPGGPFGSRPPLEVHETNSLYVPGMYDELELVPLRGTRIVPGVRLDYTKANKTWDLQPRLNARQDLNKGFPRTTIKGGVGRFAQPPLPQQITPPFGTAGVKSVFTNQYGFGAEQQITKQIEVSTEGFYRQYDGIVVSRLGNVGEGRAFGIETLLRYKPDDRFFGFLAYTLSRSVRKEAPQDPEHLFNFDQTHILTAIGSYRLGGGWEIGARFRYVSGSLRTFQQYGFYDLTVGAYVPSIAYPPFNERNPAFHQLDIRIDKTWIMGDGVKVSAYLDVYNAYNQGNIEGVSYNYNHTLRTFATGVPLLPSIGLRIEM